MSKFSKVKNKYYAIKKGNGVKDIIVRSWDECKPLVNGYPAIYKSFLTEDEALTYLGSIAENKISDIQEQTVAAIKKNKVKKATTKPITGLRIENGLYKKLEAKCNNFDITIHDAIKDLIKEWVE